MAIVSSVPILPESIDGVFQSHDFGVMDRLMGREGGGIGVEAEAPVVVDEKIFVAVGKEVKDGKDNLLWVLKHFAGKRICLLHVHQPAQMIPFFGGKFPANKLREEEVKAYRDLEKLKMHKMLNEYLFMCAQVGVRAEKFYIEMENIEDGIVELVAQHGIKKLIMGAASGKHKRISTIKSKKAIFVSQQAHSSCHIWFVWKGSLIYSREGIIDGWQIQISESPLTSSITETSQADHLRSRSVTVGQGEHLSRTSPVKKFILRVRSHGRRVTTVDPLDGIGGTLMPPHSLRAQESVNEVEAISRGSPSQGSCPSPCSSIQESEEDIRQSSPMNELDGRISREMYSQLQQAMIEIETSKREALEELVKRRKAEKDAIEGIRKAKESESLYVNELKQRKEMEVALARDTSEIDQIKRQRDEVVEELWTVQDQKMALERQVADSGKMLQELEEKIVKAVELLISFKQERDRLQIECDNAVKEVEQLRKMRGKEPSSSQGHQFLSEFSFSELDAATRNFDPRLIIGQGGYGSVYKGYLRNTDVAIKLLNSGSKQGRLEFQQEVEVLSRMRHPNLVTLIGTCPEVCSLIYEYLPNGNLEDRLACKDNTPPLQWQTRIRIAVDVCSALIFLHCNKPHGIVHGDLKPSNLLLDANFISKLGDFGICCSITGDETSTNSTTLCYRPDNPKGTILYMDPEFLSTGELTPKSDVYSFGIVLLQLLTGRPALGIAKEVQHAVDEGSLSALLDSSAGDWPFVQAKQLAHMALRCCEMNRKNRPDLISEVWRVLEPMQIACGTSSSFCQELCQIPSYFMCPIFQEIMRDPRVAADGFTYEAEAIKGWMDGGHDTSPMTNLKLEHSELIPNHSLKSAIEEWRQQH